MSFSKRLRYILELIAVRALAVIINLLPRGLAEAAGRGFGRLAFLVDRKHRQVALDNLEAVLAPELLRSQREEIARSAFENTALTVIDLVRIPSMSEGDLSEFVKVAGYENIKNALSAGKGVILITAHIGSWEMGFLIGRLVDVPFSLLYRPLNNPYVDRFLKSLREPGRARLIPKQGAAFAVVSRLRRNEVVGFPMDQVVRKDFVVVPFMGRPAATTSFPAAVALKTGAVVVPGFCLRLQGGRHLVDFGPPIPIVRSGNREQDILDNTARLNQVIEKAIRQNPHQWLWLHNRWKRFREMDSPKSDLSDKGTVTNL